MVQACEYIFKNDRAIIIREYNSGQKQSCRSCAVWQRIDIRKNATFWRLHLRMRALVAVCLISPIFCPQLGRSGGVKPLRPGSFEKGTPAECRLPLGNGQGA
jgi:hypothetical protein